MRYWLAFKVLLFTVLVPGSVTVYLPYRLLINAGATLTLAPMALSVPALACLAIGLTVYLRCAWDFASKGLGTPAPIDPPKHLVISGLYRWNRNPMYQGVLLLLLSESLLFTSFDLLVYAISVAVIFHLFVVLHEEPLLNRRFGDAYRQYCLQVPRWGIARQPFDS